jgi:hypothetical protein
MVEELIAFLNFNFELELKAAKLVENDAVTTVARWGLNWREYLQRLTGVGVDVDDVNRVPLNRYKNLQSGPEFYQDLLNFQDNLRLSLADAFKSQKLPYAFVDSVFRQTNGLPAYYEPVALHSDLSPENIANLQIARRYETPTYGLFIQAILRDLIIHKKIFHLSEADGVFFLATPFDQATEPSSPDAGQTKLKADEPRTAQEAPRAETASQAPPSPRSLAPIVEADQAPKAEALSAAPKSKPDFPAESLTEFKTQPQAESQTESQTDSQAELKTEPQTEPKAIENQAEKPIATTSGPLALTEDLAVDDLTRKELHSFATPPAPADPDEPSVLAARAASESPSLTPSPPTPDAQIPEADASLGGAIKTFKKSPLKTRPLAAFADSFAEPKSSSQDLGLDSGDEKVLKN